MADGWDGISERRKVVPYQEQVLAELSVLRSYMEKVVRFIEGNGNPERGAIIRMDRLEQKMLMVWGLAAAVGGLTLKAVFEWVVR